MTNTLLINKEHKIKDSYFAKVKLQKVKNYKDEEILIEQETYQAFLKLQAFLKTKGIIIAIDSAYRSIEEQANLYQEFVNYYQEDYAQKMLAPVGYSEHHTGLAIDINILINGNYAKDNNEIFKNIASYEAIVPYLSSFGFILRYPKEKEAITKYTYEPWHIRYVGDFVAPIIAKNNWTLEEYLEQYSGLIIVNKEPGMTSFDVVHEISKLFGIKRVGHTGTLDPLAEGVLLVALNKATKVVELLTAEDKEYEATVQLGFETDTLDITGKITKQTKLNKLTNLEATLNSYQKTYLQEVPLYSAIKINGQKLYEYARKNIAISLPKKEVTIKNIQLLNSTPTEFTFKALVSKGCYIRSLIRDITHSLNTYGTMSKLIRTKQGLISLARAKTLSQIKNNDFSLLPIEEALNYPIINVNEKIEKEISHGLPLANNYFIQDKVIFKNKKNKLLGIYTVKNEQLVVWKNFI